MSSFGISYNSLPQILVKTNASLAVAFSQGWDRADQPGPAGPHDTFHSNLPTQATWTTHLLIFSFLIIIILFFISQSTKQALPIT